MQKKITMPLGRHIWHYTYHPICKWSRCLRKATFQESALVIYDQQYSNSVIMSVGLETIDNQEIKFTDELVQKINENDKDQGSCIYKCRRMRDRSNK